MNGGTARHQDRPAREDIARADSEDPKARTVVSGHAYAIPARPLPRGDADIRNPAESR